MVVTAWTCTTAPADTFACIDTNFRDTWGDWAAYRWDQITATATLST